jgi:hypothetical protein
MRRRRWPNRHWWERMGANASTNLVDFLILVGFLFVAHDSTFLAAFLPLTTD